MIRAALVLSVGLVSTEAIACVAGSKCIKPTENFTTYEYNVGDTLPRGKYQVLLNAKYYGLPVRTDGTWYYRVEKRVLRVNPQTMEILEDVTHSANRSF